MAVRFKKSLLRPLAVGVLLAAAGCSSVPHQISGQALGGKRIGVVSVAAQSLTRRHVGLTVFGNEEESLDISSWNVDATYEQRLAEALSALGYDVVRQAYSAVDFLRIRELNGPYDAPAFRGPNWKATETAIRRYCAGGGVDLIAMAYSIQSSDVIGNSNQWLDGAGVYTSGIGSNTRLSYLHLLADVALIDCASARPLASRRLSPVRGRTFVDSVRNPVTKELDPAISRKPLAELSAVELETLRRGLGEMAADAWAPTVGGLLDR